MDYELFMCVLSIIGIFCAVLLALVGESILSFFMCINEF